MFARDLHVTQQDTSCMSLFRWAIGLLSLTEGPFAHALAWLLSCHFCCVTGSTAACAPSVICCPPLPRDFVNAHTHDEIVPEDEDFGQSLLFFEADAKQYFAVFLNLP